MIITESNVSMSSTRQYSQSGLQGKGMSGASFLGSTAANLSSNARDTFQKEGENFLDLYERFSGEPASTGNVSKAGSKLSNSQTPSTIQNSILNRLMDRLMSNNVFGQNFGMPSAGFRSDGSSVRFNTYQEYESTSFSAYGQAKTADGRTIDFGIEMMMSRSYMEYTDIQLSPLNNALIDPLIINVDSSITSISDQKFMFDLDMDGKEEEISSLGRGSGFLALDLNEDGVINDGRELFGAKTGDGFGELRQYDSDGNGWIDEADEIFSRLKVWCKNDDGTDTLMDLKQAGVGAIYLGEQSTEFSQYGLGGLNGVVRSTGFFLKEDGGVGTVQHVDLAASNEAPPVNYTKTYEMQSGQVINIKFVQSEENRESSGKMTDSDVKNTTEKIREKNKERRKALDAMLLKKRKERKEMLDKQLEKNLEKNREKSKEAHKAALEAYEEHLI